MPGNYEKFLSEAVRSGYDVPAVELEVRKAMPQLFLLARQNKVPLETIKQRLNDFGLPSHLWMEPSKAEPPSFETQPGQPPQDLEERMARVYVPESPTRRGPTDPDMTGVFQQIAKALTMPGRGIAGLGVGAVNLPKGLGVASERAAAATQPGFQPQGRREWVANVAGQMTGDAALGMAMAAPAGGAARAVIGAGEMLAEGAGISRAAQVAKALLTGRASLIAKPLGAGLAISGAEGAAVGVGFQALQELAQTGHISTENLKEAMALGAVAGGMIHLGAQAARALAPQVAARAKALWEKIGPPVKLKIQSELATLRYQIKKGMGIPQETGLQVQSSIVPYEIQLAVAQGRMTITEAARKSEAMFKQQLGIRGLKTVPGEVPTSREMVMDPEAIAKPPTMPQEGPISQAAQVPTGPESAPPAPLAAPRLPKTKGKARRAVVQAPKDPFAVPAPGPQTPVQPSPLAPVGPQGPFEPAQSPAGATPPAPEPPAEPVVVQPKKGRPATPQLPAPVGSTPLGIAPKRKGPIWPGAEEPVVTAPKAAPEPAVPTEVKSVPEIPEPVAGHPPSQFSMAAMTVEDFYLKHDKILSAKQVFELIEDKSGPLQFVDDFLQTFGKKKMRASAWADILNAKKAELEKAETSPTAPISAPPAAAPAISPEGPQAVPAISPEPMAPMTVEIVAKARKQEVLNTVEKALAEAKPEKSFEKTTTDKKGVSKTESRDPGIVEIDIDGGIKVKNTKEALTDLRARLKQLPERATLGRQKFNFQKLTYTAARQERFQPMIAIEGKSEWFTDGRVMIKGVAPARIEKSDRGATPAKAIDDLVSSTNAAAKPAKFLFYAVKNSMVEGVSPVPIDDRLSYDKKPPMAVFETPTGYMAFDQRYTTAIVNRHPDVEWFVDEAGARLVGRVAGEPVGIVQALAPDTDRLVKLSEPPLATEAQISGLYEPRKGGQLVEDIDPLPGEAPAYDLLAGTEQNLPLQEPPITTPDDKRRAFATFMLTKVDNVRAREILTDLATKIGTQSIQYAEKMGMSKGQADVGSFEIKLADRDNIATMAHEIMHLIDAAMGSFKKTGKFGLAGKVGQPDNAELDEILRKELKGVAQFVRPYYPTLGDWKTDKHWTTYRAGHPELHVDWGTLFLVDPQMARNLAPTYTDLWVKHLQGFPKIKAALEPFMGAESPLLKASTGDRKPVDIGKFIMEWVKAPELDQAVQDLRKTKLDLTKEQMQRLYNLIGLPFWKGQKDPRAGSVVDSLQGITYRASRLESIGLERAEFDDLVRLPPESITRIARAIYLGNDQPIQRYFNSNELARSPFNFTPQEIEGYQRVVKANRFVVSMLVKLYKAKIGFDALPVESRAAVEIEIRESIEKLGGYFSLMRFGDHVAYGLAPDGKNFWYSFEKTEGEANRTANELAKIGYSQVKVSDRQKLPPEFWQAVARRGLSNFEIEMLIEQSGADRNDPNVMALLATAQKFRFKDMIHRKWVSGFKKTGENLIESIEAHLSEVAHRLAKFEGMRSARKTIDKIDVNREPILRQDMERYLKQFSDASSDELYWFRRVFYSWNLSMKIAFFLQNLTQPLMTTWNEIARFTGGLNPERIMLNAYSKTFRVLKASFGESRYNLEGLTNLEGYLLRRAEKEGLVSGQFTEEMFKERFGTKFKWEKFLGFLGHSSEQINRVQALLSAAEIAEGRGMKPKEAYAFVKEFIHRTQFAFGEGNQPAWVAQVGRAKGMAKLVVMFRSYTLNMLERLARQVGPEFEPRVLARTMAGLLGLAGAAGIPFDSLLKWAIWKWTDHDVDMDIRQGLGKHDKVADFVLGGIPSLADVDSRRMLGLGDIYQAPRVGSGFMESAAEFVAGPLGGSAMRAGRAMDYFRRGESRRGWEQITPTALANVLKADRISKEGLTYASGKMLIPKDQIKGHQILYTALGLTPMTFSKEYDKAQAIAELRDSTKRRKGVYLERMAKALGKKDMAEVQRVRHEIEENNVAARKARKPENIIMISGTAIRRRIWEMRTAGIAPTIKTAPRQLRRRMLEIDKAYQ